MDLEKCKAGLILLLGKYGVNTPEKLVLSEKDGEFFVNGTPLMPWRRERRFFEMKGIKNSGRAGALSVLRSGRIVNRNSSLREEILRELDISEWLLDEATAKIFASVNGPTANIVVTEKSGVVCTLEIAATLNDGAPILDRHEINTRRGVISDRAVDTQIPQSSVYTFTSDGQKEYTDVDFELYGLDYDAINLVRDAYAVIVGNLYAGYTERRKYLELLTDAVFESAEKNICVDINADAKGGN